MTRLGAKLGVEMIRPPARLPRGRQKPWPGRRAPTPPTGASTNRGLALLAFRPRAGSRPASRGAPGEHRRHLPAQGQRPLAFGTLVTPVAWIGPQRPGDLTSLDWSEVDRLLNEMSDEGLTALETGRLRQRDRAPAFRRRSALSWPAERAWDRLRSRSARRPRHHPDFQSLRASLPGPVRRHASPRAPGDRQLALTPRGRTSPARRRAAWPPAQARPSRVGMCALPATDVFRSMIAPPWRVGRFWRVRPSSRSGRRPSSFRQGWERWSMISVHRGQAQRLRRP